MCNTFMVKNDAHDLKTLDLLSALTTILQKSMSKGDSSQDMHGNSPASTLVDFAYATSLHPQSNGTRMPWTTADLIFNSLFGGDLATRIQSGLNFGNHPSGIPPPTFDARPFGGQFFNNNTKMHGMSGIGGDGRTKIPSTHLDFMNRQFPESSRFYTSFSVGVPNPLISVNFNFMSHPLGTNKAICFRCGDGGSELGLGL